MASGGAERRGNRMIEFSNFYQLIAKNHLSHWLETLPAQIAAWQRDQQHGLLKQWSNAVEYLPELTPHRMDLLHSVTAESEEPLSPGQANRIDTLMRNLMPWRKGPFSLYGVNIENGILAYIGTISRLLMPIIRTCDAHVQQASRLSRLTPNWRPVLRAFSRSLTTVLKR
jgi:hypothetical protein